MRTSNSLKNIFVSIVSQVILVLLGFISRKVFLDSLGVNYLGINGLLTNVLSLLALVESGIGTSIVYQLYKPLAENNKPKIIALVQIYKKAYAVLAIILFFLSLGLFPFLDDLMKGGAIPYLTIIYFIFVGKNMTYFLNAHKLSLISADQKGYVLSTINFGFQIFTSVVKIAILILTKNYILYLLIELVIFIIQNIFSGKIVEKRYAYIKTKNKYYIDRNEKESLIKNVKAMFLHNIGTYAVFGTDNLLISKFVGIASVGLYSNYTMIISQMGSLISPVLGGIGASVGNLIATENSNKNYFVFKVTYFVNFWIYSFCVIFLYNLLEPFIDWWLGKGFLLNSLTFIFILINFYLMGMKSSILTFKIKGGIFVQDKYMPLIEAVLNLGTSIILVKQIGLAGIFIGTTISTLCVFWVGPFLVYKHIFKVQVWSYFLRLTFYTLLTILTCQLTTITCNLLINGEGFLSLMERGVLSLIIPNAVYIMVFIKSKEFQYILHILKSMMLGLRVKLSPFQIRNLLK